MSPPFRPKGGNLFNLKLRISRSAIVGFLMTKEFKLSFSLKSPKFPILPDHKNQNKGE